MSKLTEWLSTDERRMEFAEEELIVDAAEEIWSAMDKAKVTKSELAERLGKSKAFVSQVLNGSRNMTLRSLADIAYCIGFRVQVSLQVRTAHEAWGQISGALVAPFGKPYLASASVPQPVAEPVGEVEADTWTSMKMLKAA
jgi:transcriptional regulator with XRE-family HTH domain